MSKSLQERYASSALFGSNATAVEDLYEQFMEDAESVSAEWRAYFQGICPADAEPGGHL